MLGIECKSVIEKITDMLRPGNASDLEHWFDHKLYRVSWHFEDINVIAD